MDALIAVVQAHSLDEPVATWNTTKNELTLECATVARNPHFEEPQFSQ